MTSPTIKAIETHYKGYRFRSRLEARWAVFFDTLGIEWQYEPEGFELPDGTRYLPDFWLPYFESYVEIKGQTPSGAEYKKAQHLAKSHPVFIFAGDPYAAFAWHFSWASLFAENPCVIEQLGPTNCTIQWVKNRYGHCITFFPDDDRDWEKPNLIMRGDAQMACTRARSARFEHGERA